MTYSRLNPSPDYQELQEQYRILHEQGGDRTTGRKVEEKNVFANGEYSREAPKIKELMKKHHIRSIINFGCGKPDTYFNKKMRVKNVGVLPPMHEYLGKPYVRLYDPGVEEISQYPDMPAEMVICTDVLEHIPEPDIPWFLDELAELATKVLHVSIHLGPAMALLPNGENAHVTIRPAEWWEKKIAEAQKRCKHRLTWSIVKRYPIGEDGQIKNIDYSEYGYVAEESETA